MRYKIKPTTVAAVYALAILVAMVFLYPYLWMVINSFRASKDIVSKPLALFSGNFSFGAYQNISVMGGKSLFHYARNSLIITVSSVVLTLIVCSLGAYALTRKQNSPFFKLILTIVLVSIMYPWALLIIPVYIVVIKLGLIGTHVGIVLAITGGTGIALPFFLFQQFFRQVPDELIECACVEGAGEVAILTKIVIPMSRPVYGTVTLIQFMLLWGEWFYVSVLSNSLSTASLPVSLLNMNSELGIELNEVMALSALISVPIIILFIITQQRVMEGLAQGSLKE